MIHDLAPMPRDPSFEPRPIVRHGEQTGLWRIIVPDETRRVRGRKAWRELTFADLEEATEYGDRLRAEYHANRAGLAAADPADALRYNRLLRRAAKLGFESLESVLDAIESSNSLNPAGPTLAAILEAYETHKYRAWSPKMLSTWKTCTRPFEPLMLERAAALDPQDWEEFFNDLHDTSSLATSSFNRCITFLKASYDHAVHLQMLAANPVTNIKRIRSDLERDPVIIEAATIRRFFSAAVDHHPETVPYWTLCFFAGARPDSEAFRVRWEHILWNRKTAAGRTGEILIAKPTDRTSRTKTRKDRYVEMEPNLAEWLRHYRRDSGLIVPTDDNGKPNRRLIRASRENIACGMYEEPGENGEFIPLIEWGSQNRDLTRHTYATAFAKAHAGDTGFASVSTRLKENLGHASENTADRYYKNPHLTNAQAKAIFAISPTAAQRRKIRSLLNSR